MIPYPLRASTLLNPPRCQASRTADLVSGQDNSGNNSSGNTAFAQEGRTSSDDDNNRKKKKKSCYTITTNECSSSSNSSRSKNSSSVSSSSRDPPSASSAWSSAHTWSSEPSSLPASAELLLLILSCLLAGPFKLSASGAPAHYIKTNVILEHDFSSVLDGDHDHPIVSKGGLLTSSLFGAFSSSSLQSRIMTANSNGDSGDAALFYIIPAFTSFSIKGDAASGARQRADPTGVYSPEEAADVVVYRGGDGDKEVKRTDDQQVIHSKVSLKKNVEMSGNDKCPDCVTIQFGKPKSRTEGFIHRFILEKLPSENRRSCHGCKETRKILS